MWQAHAQPVINPARLVQLVRLRIVYPVLLRLSLQKQQVPAQPVIKPAQPVQEVQPLTVLPVTLVQTLPYQLPTHVPARMVPTLTPLVNPVINPAQLVLLVPQMIVSLVQTVTTLTQAPAKSVIIPAQLVQLMRIRIVYPVLLRLSLQKQQVPAQLVIQPA
jgi:hypothetical protein